mmetsp:Transcript_9226/g.19396  ORF Transcript_9226/g.19396 Transcript_9226/m.19396 type:complete len:583 (-) Transcript_9226:45-1793(-)
MTSSSLTNDNKDSTSWVWQSEDSYQKSISASHPQVNQIKEEENARERVNFPTMKFMTILLLGIVFWMGVAVTGTKHEGRHDKYGLSYDTVEKWKKPAFPPEFIWGAATSAFQIEGGASEGGRGPSIWDVWCVESTDNCNGDTGDVSDDHYHHWRDDVELMKNMGLKAYRFSISWSRILPNGTADFTGDDDSGVDGINFEGIKFYNDLIDALISAGIEPFVTLHHWDLPQSLQDRYGGWINSSVIQDFADYARICFHYFGDRVKYWITINEGWTVAIHGYEEGSNAPGLMGEDVGGTGKPYTVGHHLLLAHARAVKVFREEGYSQKFDKHGDRSLIGLSNSGDFRFPLDPANPDDIEAATRAMEFQLGWMTDPIWHGEYPASMRERLGSRLPQFSPKDLKELIGSADFLGLNHYSSAIASKPTSPPTYGGYWAEQYVTLSSIPSWKKTFMGWNIAPEGGREMLLWIDKRYNHPLIFVTENGMAAYEPDMEHSLHDFDRVEYLQGYISGFGEAIARGVNLAGYFAWSLMDNFEWQYGSKRRFGLVHVNYTTLVRTPKASAQWYTENIAHNGEAMLVNDHEFEKN